MYVLQQILKVSPQYVPPHIQIMIDAPIAANQCRLDRLFKAERLYGPGFLSKAIDEDDVFDEVLVAVFINRTQCRLCRYMRSNFRQQYVSIEFPECSGCERPCEWRE